VRRPALLIALLGLGGSLLAVAPVTEAASAAPPAAHYQFGIDTYVTYNCVGASLMDQRAATVVAEYKALRANAIGIGFPIYTPSITSNLVYARDVCNDQAFQSPSPAILAGIIKIAHAAKLQVLLRPMIDQTNLSREGLGYWRGLLKPTNLHVWFTNYMNTLKPYLRMAQANHVEHVAIATELDSMNDFPNWKTAIAEARRIYGGDVVWNYSWKSSQRKLTRPGTSFAIDAYPSLLGTTNSTPSWQLAKLWGKLLPIPQYKLPNITHTTIDEIDIPAQDGAYAFPYANLPLQQFPFNQTIQARWFTAACSFVKQHHLRGIYYWGPWLSYANGALLTAPDPDRPTDIQPAAQAAVKTCFAG
jgi:hypothetical protein